ncbi:hypothetical protein HKD21_10710 [Gluconobacter cerevisiae]|uniref:Cupin n=1 Tax=Gluconobacter cerevisiae TaxID=1379734 RepID=A0ABR9YFE9_9PROT|nr:hypothetical protein [Gluconobacter cerevisiae]MBF0877316.1 hypothetical protein [Gluconobacter cerevisiae]
MSIHKRLFSLLGALSVPVLGAAAHAASIEDKPSFPTIAYWDNWTDPQGTTHLTKCKMSTFHEDSLTPDGEKVMLSSSHDGPTTVTLRVQPPHWKSGWSESHQVQWIVPLSGIYFVKAMDGTSVELNPGDILLSEDVAPIAHGSDPKGHLSGNVGDTAVALQVLQFGDAKPSHIPCQWQ